jgi:hypothetical protein
LGESGWARRLKSQRGQDVRLELCRVGPRTRPNPGLHPYKAEHAQRPLSAMARQSDSQSAGSVSRNPTVVGRSPQYSRGQWAEAYWGAVGNSASGWDIRAERSMAMAA